MNKNLLTYLPRDRKKTLSLADQWIVRVVFATLLICMAGVIIHVYWDSKTTARIPIASENWHALIPWTDGECRTDLPTRSSCVASVERKDLWNATVIRGSNEYYEKLRFNRGNQYWLGAVVPKMSLIAASHESANTLVISSIFGTADVWIDGVFHNRSDYLNHDLPLHVVIPRQRLSEPRDLLVALRITPNPHFTIPEKRDFVGSDGFFTAYESDRVMRRSMFTGITRHLVVLGLFMLLAHFLMSAASAEASSYDYIVGAQFALLLGTIFLLATHLLTPFLKVPGFYRFFFLLTFWEGYFVLRLILAVLRIRREISIRSTMFLIFSSIGLSFVSPFWIESTGLTLMTSYYLPAFYGAGAVVVGWRAYQVSVRPGEASKSRVEFLILQFFLLTITALCYFIEGHNFPGTEVYWSRTLNIFTLFLLVRQITKGQANKLETATA